MGKLLIYSVVDVFAQPVAVWPVGVACLELHRTLMSIWPPAFRWSAHAEGPAAHEVVPVGHLAGPLGGSIGRRVDEPACGSNEHTSRSIRFEDSPMGLPLLSAAAWSISPP